jgi:hypothetical protein
MARRALGISWMTRYELGQAVPPIYTEFIGKQLLQHLGGDAETLERPITEWPVKCRSLIRDGNCE